MIPFDPAKTSLGRHETFPLRFGWLAKGYTEWCVRDEDPFEDTDAMVNLGVGKNMVHAIRYWMVATQVAEAKGRSITPTELGRRVIGPNGWDPYLEDDVTIWLLHWLLASNAQAATSIFWFFNRFHKPEFSVKELNQALKEFLSENVQSDFADSTVEHDSALILRMYARSADSKDVVLEETLDSPLSLLDLVRRLDNGRTYQSTLEYRDSLPVPTLAFAVLDIAQTMGLSVVPIERIMRNDGLSAAPGSVFRISEECLIAKLEHMIKWLLRFFQLRETAGLNQLYINKRLSPLEALERYYEANSKELAA